VGEPVAGVDGKELTSAGGGERYAAADEVHDFEAVASFNGGVRPRRARGDVAVMLDCDTIAFEAQSVDQLVKGGGFGERFEGAGLAVEQQGERHVAL